MATYFSVNLQKGLNQSTLKLSRNGIKGCHLITLLFGNVLHTASITSQFKYNSYSVNDQYAVNIIINMHSQGFYEIITSKIRNFSNVSTLNTRGSYNAHF